MPEKFKSKYRIASTRLRNWDYGANASYFVTICTQNREHYFGDVRNGTMIMSTMGMICNDCWLEIPQHFPFVLLHAHVVMPNHVHGILTIDKQNNVSDVGTVDLDVETQHFASLHLNQPQPSSPTNENPPCNRFGPQSQNLASIIRGFKIGVTKQARLAEPRFAWQSRFHDHIIRNEGSYHRISEYIINNPKNWAEDMFNKT